jgi:hypothetical protein
LQCDGKFWRDIFLELAISRVIGSDKIAHIFVQSAQFIVHFFLSKAFYLIEHSPNV